MSSEFRVLDGGKILLMLEVEDAVFKHWINAMSRDPNSVIMGVYEWMIQCCTDEADKMSEEPKLGQTKVQLVNTD